MKNAFKIFAFALASLSLTACSDDKSNKSYDDYKKYVSDHHDNSDKYYDRDWNEIENEYKEVQRNAEADMANWNDERKAEYESMKLNWDVYRESYMAEKNRRDALEGSKMVMKAILPDGISEDMSNVDNSNILAVHKHFVEAVEGMKDSMTREQWDYAEILWERLGTRKNELEKEMKTETNLAIAEQKIAYSAIKATNRPVAKSDENAAAKEDGKQ